MEYPSYYSILTADVRYDPRLKKYADCKILFSEITALSNKFGYCKASNKYFAQLYDRPIPTISKWINILKGLGYLKIEMIYKENSNQILERRMFPISTPINAGVNTYSRTHEEGIHADVKTPINADVKDNNININNTSNNNSTTTTSTGDNQQEQTAYELIESLGVHFNSVQQDDFLEYSRTVDDGLIKQAVLRAAKKQSYPKWSLIEGILKTYLDHGIRTAEEAKAFDKEYEEDMREYNDRRREYRKNQYRPGQTNYQATGAVDFLDPRRLDEM